ncbi:MAG: hypothetical protein AB9873_09635 [Syntrophobacteraceae bacterium]
MTLERQHSNQLNANLSRMNERQSRTALYFVALLRQATRLSGCQAHRLIHRWLSSDAEAMLEPMEWLRENGACSRWSRRQQDEARRISDQWIARGLWCALRQRYEPVSTDPWSCPAVVFGTGADTLERPHVSVFNSRTPRLRAAGEEWLKGLRLVLPHAHSKGLGVASSVGTLTYDLVTAYSERAEMPLSLWLPAPMETLLEKSARAPFSRPFRLGLQMTCLASAFNCSLSTRAVCRDRMLAELADIHCVLQIRRGGNLERILRSEQSRRPRIRWRVQSALSTDSKRVARPKPDPDATDSPATTTIFQAPDASRTTEGKARDAHGMLRCLRRLHEVDWSRFLCHYTRACAGPWPGQAYEEYLSALLDGGPHHAHTALDTLIRIVEQDLIRASAKLLRGKTPAISFTSIAPFDLTRLRQWNKALARWTVEPYGFGIDRVFLKHAGIKPVVYGPPVLYERLKERDRFRFQMHMPPSALWRHEREWRYPGDLALSAIPSSMRLIFVRTVAEAARLATEIGEGWVVVALDD